MIAPPEENIPMFWSSTTTTATAATTTVTWWTSQMRDLGILSAPARKSFLISFLSFSFVLSVQLAPN